MDKKKAILSILVIMLAFLAVGILNVVMGRPSLLTAKLREPERQKITEINPEKSGEKSKSEEDKLASIPLEKILVHGANGDPVKRVQSILKAKGYYNGDINGNFDDALGTSIKEFQKDNDIRQSGIVSLSTIEALTGLALNNPYRAVKISRTILVGNNGEDVEKVQYLLTKAGYYGDEINGILDDKTKKSVMALQRDYGIPQTGNVGNMTLKVLLDME